MKQSKSTRAPGRTPRKPKPAAGRKAAPRTTQRSKAAPRAAAARKVASGRAPAGRAKVRAGAAAASAPRSAAGATTPALRDAPISRNAGGPLALPAECIISCVDDIKAGLVQRLESAEPVTIDASAVQRIDTASLQVLAAFARDRRAAGLAFAWSGVPAAVSDAAALLNLTDTLGLDAAAAADADTVLA